jgi:hypothetical protein
MKKPTKAARAANATALPAIGQSRRQFLRASAMPSLMIPLLAAVPASAEPIELSPVLQLIERCHAVHREWIAAEDHADDLYAAAVKDFPSYPPCLVIRSGQKMDRRRICDIHPATEAIVGATKAAELRDKRLAALDAYEQACDEVCRRFGQTEASARATSLSETLHRLVVEIAATPSLTARDAAAKLHIADDVENYHQQAIDPDEPHLVAPKMICSAMADLDRLAARGA